MATIKGPVQLEGGVGGMSFYTRRGSDKIIVRTKGGPSKQAIKNSPGFENLRLNQKEWKGCTSFASRLRFAFGGLHRVADYNLTPALNAFAKNLQKTDENSEKGTRNILFSSYRNNLNGFNFNRNYLFNSVLRVSVVAVINRENVSASISLPRINTEIDVLNVQRLPYFRLVASLGAVSDMLYDASTNTYNPANEQMHGINATYTGEWLPAENILPEQTIEVSMNENFRKVLTEDVTLVVSIAVEFGKVGFTGVPQEVKYAGCGKVLVCG